MANKDFFSIDSLNQMLFTWTIAMVIFILVIWAIAFSFNSLYLPIQTGVFYLTDIQHIEAKTKISPKVNGSGQASTTLTNTDEHILLIGELRRFEDPSWMTYSCTIKIPTTVKHSYEKRRHYLCSYIKYRLSNEYKIIDIQGEYKN